MAGLPKLTEEQKDEIRKLRQEEKLPYTALAAKYQVSSQTIIRICRPEHYERQKAANREYQANNRPQINKRLKGQYRNYSLAFHIKNDKAVIEFLDRQDNIHHYLRKKVLEDIHACSKQDKKK